MPSLTLRRPASLLFIILPVLVSLACTTVLGGSAGPTPAPVRPTQAPVGSTSAPGKSTQTPAGAATVAATEASVQPTALAEALFGPGPFNLADPQAGLADLDSYQATLTISFDGTHDGASQKWSKTYTMLTARHPAGRQLTIAKKGDLADAAPVLMVEAAGVAYELLGEQGCVASVLEADHSPARQLEPAGLLTGVLGADEAGQETVNEVDAKHYTFDERALGQLGIAKSSGELWLASNGGYLVRYVSSTTGDANFFGAGIEGTLTWDYELTGINQPAAIAAPKSCPAGLIDVPQLPDAADVQSTPGLLTFSTASSLADTTAFYLDQLPGQGWKLAGDPAAIGTPAPDQKASVLNFNKDNQQLTVIISAGENATRVRIVQSTAPG